MILSELGKTAILSRENSLAPPTGEIYGLGSDER